MCKSLDLQRPMSHESVLLVGGCHGTCFLRDQDGPEGATTRRQFLLANALIFAVCLAIITLAVAFLWS